MLSAIQTKANGNKDTDDVKLILDVMRAKGMKSNGIEGNDGLY